jgi:hypothetical protein
MKTTFYVQLEPRYNTWKDYQTGRYQLRDVVATRVTQTRPNKPSAKSITVKLTVDVPASVFEPFEPAVEIVIPESMVEQNIAVEVEDAREPEAE